MNHSAMVSLNAVLIWGPRVMWQVFWKDYSPSHFCGATGTFNGIDESIPNIPPREKCEPASVGEFWCAHGSFPFPPTLLSFKFAPSHPLPADARS